MINVTNFTYDPFMVVCEETVYIPFVNSSYLIFLSVFIFFFSLFGFYYSSNRFTRYSFVLVMIFSFTISSILLVNTIFA